MLTKGDEAKQKVEIFKQRIVNVLLSITGFLYNDVDMISRIIPALRIENKLKEETF